MYEAGGLAAMGDGVPGGVSPELVASLQVGAEGRGEGGRVASA